MTRKIKNIVFDLGGVVVGYDPKEFLIRCFYNKKTEEYIYNLVFGSDLWRRLDQGLVSREEADEIFLKQARKDGYLFEVQAALDDWKSMLQPKQDTIALIKTLRKNGYRTYYLSNLPIDLAEEFEKNSRFQRLFDGGVVSSREKLLKPDTAIYTLLLERYSLIAGETIFCDDNRENAAAAAQAGILGVQYLGAKNFQKLLKGYGVRAYAPKEQQKQEKADQEEQRKKNVKTHFTKKKVFAEKKAQKPLARKPAAAVKKSIASRKKTAQQVPQDELKE